MHILPQRHWYKSNWQRLNAWLETLKGGEVAVFDWDNTSIFNDISIVVFRYLLLHARLKLSQTQLQQVLPDSVNGISTLASGIVLSDLNYDILQAYQAEGLQARRDLAAKILWLYDELEATPGIGALYAYPWMATLLGGFTEAELQAVAVAAYQTYVGEAVTISEIQSSSGAARSVTWRYMAGVAKKPEIQDLMQALRSRGAEVFIVTASQQDLVRGLAAYLQYPVNDVFGLHLEKQASGVMLPVCASISEKLVPYREGKSAVIRAKIGREPVLVAGDTNGDFNMLTDFARTQMRLVIHRNLPGDIQKLYQTHTAPSNTLVQGRLEREARFHDAKESLLLS